MKSFLLNSKTNTPTLKWGLIPKDTHFIGDVPEGHYLAVSPSDNYIVVDIDNKPKGCGFDNIPLDIMDELEQSLHYTTKSRGMHVFLLYTGDKKLINRTSNIFVDLRTNKGYVRYYHNVPIQECMHLIKETSKDLNLWIENLFA
jgi:hypothetical protein